MDKNSFGGIGKCDVRRSVGMSGVVRSAHVGVRPPRRGLQMIFSSAPSPSGLGYHVSRLRAKSDSDDLWPKARNMVAQPGRAWVRWRKSFVSPGGAALTPTCALRTTPDIPRFFSHHTFQYRRRVFIHETQPIRPVDTGLISVGCTNTNKASTPDTAAQPKFRSRCFQPFQQL